jgi:cytochrome P450
VLQNDALDRRLGVAVPNLPVDFDVNDPDMYLTQGLPRKEWEELRRTAPVWWQSQPRGRDGFDDEGHWVLTRHADVKEVSRQDRIFSSWENCAIIRYHEGMQRENIEMQRVIMLNMDAPQHTRMRSIISRGFTPRAVNSLKDALTERAYKIVKEAAEKETGDFVRDIACELPLQAIAELLGVPQADRHKIFDWSNRMVGGEDPDGDPEDSHMASFEMLSYFMEVAEDRKAAPADDIVTKLVSAEIDGEELTSDEFGFFTILLSVAGNETTRNAISHGMLAFMAHPGRSVLRRGQLRPRGVRGSLYVRRRARPQPAPRLRRHRRALLHRREPRPARDEPDLQRGRGRAARHRGHRRAEAAALRLAQRRQGDPGRIPVSRRALTARPSSAAGSVSRPPARRSPAGSVPRCAPG